MPRIALLHGALTWTLPPPAQAVLNGAVDLAEAQLRDAWAVAALALALRHTPSPSATDGTASAAMHSAVRYGNLAPLNPKSLGFQQD